MSRLVSTRHSWDALDSYRGELFTGEWPSIPEMMEITARTFPDRPCFTSFTPDRQTDTYGEIVRKAGNIAMQLQE